MDVVLLLAVSRDMYFKDIVGQEGVKERLIRMAHSGRISHAQLFYGPEGSGALPLALAFARYLNCQGRRHPDEASSPATDACGTCPSCVKFDKLIHPDLHFIFPVATTPQVPKNPVSKNFYEKWRSFILNHGGYGNLNDWYNEIGIEKKQGLINTEDCSVILNTLSYKSYQGGYKIMIIWMVEKLFHAAALKILKVLEEPPDQTLFLLVTENPEQIIRTIRSRTQMMLIPPVEDPALRERLQSIPTLEPARVNDIVRLTNGNYREALRLVREEAPDQELFERFRHWMRLCFRFSIPEILDLSRQMAQEGREAQKNFLRYALRIIRESLLIDLRGEALCRLTQGELEFVRNFSPYVNLSNGNAFAQMLESAIQHVERNANPSILFTWLSLRISGLLRMKPA